MIRLRRMLVNGRAHPIIGPILLILLVVVLSLLFLHALEDVQDAATEVEAFCLAIATFLGLLLLERVRRHAPRPVVLVRSDRGPPGSRDLPAGAPSVAAPTGLLLIPLRR